MVDLVDLIDCLYKIRLKYNEFYCFLSDPLISRGREYECGLHDPDSDWGLGGKLKVGIMGTVSRPS